MTVERLSLTIVVFNVAAAAVVAMLASRREWSGWRHARRAHWGPMADSPITWFAVVAIIGPLGVIAYALDHSHAPMKPRETRAVAAPANGSA